MIRWPHVRHSCSTLRVIPHGPAGDLPQAALWQWVYALYDFSRGIPLNRPDKPPFTLEFFMDIAGREPVLEWARSLTPVKKRAIGVAWQEVLAYLGIDVCETEFGKNLGQGLFEFRVRRPRTKSSRGWDGGTPQPDDENIILRVYCHAYGEKIVLLLAAYDKARDASAKREQTEVGTARKRLEEFRRRVRQ